MPVPAFAVAKVPVVLEIFAVIAPVFVNPAVKVTMFPKISEKPLGVTEATTCAFALPVEVPPV